MENLENAVDSLTAAALRVKKERDEFLEALCEVRDLIEGYVDVNDGDYGVPVANKAMRATQRIDEALKLVGL